MRASSLFHRPAILLICGCFLIGNSPARANDARIEQSTWNGHYIGAALGVAYSHSKPDTSVRATGTYFVTADKTQLEPLVDESFSSSDLSGSLMWGYTKKVGKWVYGIETDLTLSDYNETYRSGNINYVSQPASTFQVSTTLKTYATATLRPRLGYIHDKTLLYVSAGPALSVFEFDFEFTDTFAAQSSRTSSRDLKLGAAFSIGGEHQLDDAWSLRAELLSTYFPNAVDDKSNLRTSQADGFDHDIGHQSHNFRIGLVKRF